MKTNEKIDFLMKITDTSNSALGKNINFDSSYISRIRSGKRNVPANGQFLHSLSSFFSEHIRNEVTVKLASDLICPEKEWPSDPEKAQTLIYTWLNEQETSGQSIHGLLSGISSIKKQEIPPVQFQPDNFDSLKNDQFFYGNNGKRQAVEAFLSELNQMDPVPELILYSNEEFNWMYDDPIFSKKWAVLLYGYIRKGGRIRIAHTISRASGEMLVALQKWIPVYMTGAIEPYYYPKIMDRVFRKTMFIARGHSAIIASSVGENSEGSVNCLIHDVNAVKVYEEQLLSFFSLCKPLMQIYNMASQDQFMKVLQQFNEECGNMITVRTTPSFFTMPDEVAENLSSRLDSSWIIQRQKTGQQSFSRMMNEGKSLTELLNLTAIRNLKTQTIPFPMCDLLGKPGLDLTREEIILHIENMIRMLKENRNYHVLLFSEFPENEIVYVKEDVGVIVVKSDFPSIAFAISEQRMVSAFWDYLNDVKKIKKEETIAALEEIAEDLKKLNRE